MATLIENKKLLDAVSFASSQTSPIDYVGDSKTFALQFVWSGATAAAGDLIVEASVDGSTFVPIDTHSISGETSGSRLVNVELAGYSNVRARWVYSSGSGGSLSVWMSSKKEDR